MIKSTRLPTGNDDHPISAATHNRSKTRLMGHRQLNRNERNFFSGGKTHSVSMKKKRGRRYRPSNNDHGFQPYRSLVNNSANDIFIKVRKSPVRGERRNVERRRSIAQNSETTSLLPLPLRFEKESNLLKKRIFTFQADKVKNGRVEYLQSAQSERVSLENRDSTSLDKGAISRTDRPIPARPSNPLRFKTELCRAHEEGGFCRFGAGCTFAHGPGELRYIPRHHKYKTEPCRSYHSVGYCQYGIRCHFIHDFEDQTLLPLTAKSESLLGQYDIDSTMHNLLESIGVQYKLPADDSMETNSQTSHQACVEEDFLLPTPWVSKTSHSPSEDSKCFMDGFLPLPVDTSKNFSDIDPQKFGSRDVQSFNEDTLFPVALAAKANNAPLENSKCFMDTILQLPIDNSKSFKDVDSMKLSSGSFRQTCAMEEALLPKPLVTKANQNFENSKYYKDMNLPLPVGNLKISADILSPVHSSKVLNFTLSPTHIEKSKAFSDWYLSSEKQSLLNNNIEKFNGDEDWFVFNSFPGSKTSGNCEMWESFLPLSNRSSQSVDCLIDEDLWLNGSSTLPSSKNFSTIEDATIHKQTNVDSFDSLSHGDKSTHTLSSAVAESVISERDFPLDFSLPGFSKFYP